MAEFLMPSLGAGMAEGTLSAWRCAPGDAVQRGDIIAEVETEKGIIEVEVFASGVVERFLVEPGTKVPVGTPLAMIREVGDSQGPAPEPSASPVAAAPSRAESTPPLPRQTPSARRLAREAGIDLGEVVGTGRHGTVVRSDVERLLPHAPGTQAPTPRRDDAEEARQPSRPRVSPLARRRARQLGVDLGRLTSTQRTVHAQDVKRAARTHASPAPSGMRRAIAAAMSQAKREIPHYYAAHTFDMTPALRWLSAQNESLPVSERLLPAALLLKAAARAMREVPELNAHWTGEGAPALERIHLGVAISLRHGGLVAPALHDADRLSVNALMAAFKDLVKRARSASLRSSEMNDATFTVTSLGDRGVDTVFPIIRPPQVAMVGFGKIAERAWSIEGQVLSRSVITATLAADHRVSDGHRGGLYLAAIERLLQAPEAL